MKLFNAVMLIFLLPASLASDATKPRRLKRSELKQEIAEVKGGNLKLSTRIAECNARIQRITIDDMYELADPQQNSFFETANVEELRSALENELKIKEWFESIIDQEEKILKKMKK